MESALHACRPRKTSNLDQEGCRPSTFESPASFEPEEAHIDSHTRARLVCSLAGKEGPSKSSTFDQPGSGVLPLRIQDVLYVSQEYGRLGTQ